MGKILILISMFLIILALVTAITTGTIYYAWNLAISPIFHIQKVTFLQAFLIGAVLSTIGGFFKSTVNKK